jgi:hypothetical protein
MVVKGILCHLRKAIVSMLHINELMAFMVVYPRGIPTDWYDSISDRQMGFQARSVVNGIFIKALLNPQIASGWKSPAAKEN